MGKRTIRVYGCVIFMALMVEQASSTSWCYIGKGYNCVDLHDRWGPYTRISCDPCNPGSFSRGGQSVCLPCDNGQFQNETGQSTCKQCARGSYQTQTGKASCIACPDQYTTLYEGEVGNGACVTTASLLTKRRGNTFDCSLRNPCYPLATTGVFAYPHSDTTLFVSCPQNGGNGACVIRPCPGGTTFELITRRCFSFTEFDCVTRDPCHLVKGTNQTKYANRQESKFVECVHGRNNVVKCVIKTCDAGIFHIPSQICAL